MGANDLFLRDNQTIHHRKRVQESDTWGMKIKESGKEDKRRGQRGIKEQIKIFRQRTPIWIARTGPGTIIILCLADTACRLNSLD